MKFYDTNLVLGKPGTKPCGIESYDQLIGKMDEYDVQQGLVFHLGGLLHDSFAGNEALFSGLKSDYLEKIKPVPVIDLNHMPTDDDIEGWINRSIGAICFCPDFYNYGVTGEMKDIVSFIKNKDLPVVFPVTPYYGAPTHCASIEQATAFATFYPEINVIITNISRGNFSEVVSALENNKNIYVDIGNLSTSTGIEMLVEKGYSNKLLCGSGYGISYITVNRDNVLYSRISGKEKQQIVYDNAAELFG